MIDEVFLKQMVALRHLDDYAHAVYIVEQQHVHETIPCLLEDEGASYYCFDELNAKSKHYTTLEDLVHDVCKSPNVVVDPLLPGEDIMAYLRRYMIQWTDVTAYKVPVTWEPAYLALTHGECSAFMNAHKNAVYRIQPFAKDMVSDGFSAMLDCAVDYARFMLQQDHRKVTVRQITRYYENQELLNEFAAIPNKWLQVGIMEFLASKELDGLSDDPCRKITVWAKGTPLSVYDKDIAGRFRNTMKQDIKVTLSYNGNAPREFQYPWPIGNGLPELLDAGSDENWLWLYDCLRLSELEYESFQAIS